MRYLLILSVFIMASCASKQAEQSKADNSSVTASSEKKAVVANAKAKATKSADKINCKKDSDLRTIEVVTNAEGCKVNYTKMEQTVVKASSEHELQHCQAVKEKMKGHLVAAGYKCE